MKRILAIVGAIVLGASPALAQSYPDYIGSRQPFSAASPSTVLPTDMLGLVRGNTTYKVPATTFSGGGGSGLTVGTTTITGGTTGRFLYDNGLLLGEAIIGSGLSFVAGTLSATGGGTGTVTNAANLTNNAIVLGDGGTVGVKTTATGTGIVTALGINIGSAGAPVLFNGAGGTPSSMTLTSATGLPISTGVSGLGSGVATFLGTPNETNLTAIVSGVTYLDVSQSFTKGQAVTPTADGTQSAAGTLTIDLSLSNYHTATFGAGNLTVANPSNTKAGECGWLSLKQDSVGSRTVSWGGNWKWAGGTAPTLTTTANASDLITFCAISATILAGQLSVANYQ